MFGRATDRAKLDDIKNGIYTIISAQNELAAGQKEIIAGQKEFAAGVKENTAVQRDTNALLKELLGIRNSGQAAGGARTGADG